MINCCLNGAVLAATNCTAPWTVCKEPAAACGAGWHMSILTAVLIAWSFAVIIPNLVWVICVMISRDATDRMAKIRDLGNVIMMSPVLAVESAAIAGWGAIKRSAVATANAGSPYLDWRKPWEYNSPEASQALGAAVAGVVFLGIFTLIASMPGIPGVDAQCTNINQFSQCSIGPHTPVIVGNKSYYLNNTAILSIGIDWEHTGDQYAWFKQDNLQGILNCNGPLANPSSNLVDLHDFALDAGGSVTVGGGLCYGGSAGVSFNLGPISPVLAATAVYCPEQTDPVQLQGVAAKLYADFSGGTTEAAFTVRASIWPQICAVATGICTPFPTNSAQNGYDLMYIDDEGPTIDPKRALVAVYAPETSHHDQSVRCAQGSCWGEAEYLGDCPQVRTSTTLSPGQLLQGAATYDPSKGVLISDQFATDVQPSWADAAIECIGAASDQPGLYNLPGYVTTAMSAPEQISLHGSCTSGGRTAVRACAADQTLSGLTGRNSPVPTDDGRPVVFSCDGANGSPAVWVRQYNPPNPAQNITCANSTVLAGLAHCEVCGNYTVCHPPGQYPPFTPGYAGQLAFGNSSVNNYQTGGNFCRLTVVSFGKDWITVNPKETPCLTSGEFGFAILNSSYRFSVPINGWAVQASGEGFLYWMFYARPERPGRQTTTTNLTVIPPPRICISDNCDCQDWDCNHDPLCLMAEATNDGCKCAFIKNGWTSATFSCKFLAVLLYTLFWGGVATIAILLIWIVYQQFRKPTSFKTEI